MEKSRRFFHNFQKPSAVAKPQLKKNMKTMLIATVMLAGLGVLPPDAKAASTPWIGVLDSTHSIVVPAGKILLIKNISANNSVAVLFTVSGSAAGGIGSGTYSTTFYYDVGPLGSPSVTQTTLQLGPGTTLSVASGTYPVFGVAMDTGDFVALVSPSVHDVSTDGTKLAVTVDSRTSAPTKPTARISTDLLTWTNGASVMQSASNPRITKVTAPANAPAKFLRVDLTKVE